MGLKERIESGEAVLGVVGLGYVGLPLALEMAKAGHKVVGFEVSAEKADLVNAGTSYIPDVPQEEFAPLVEAGLISATTDFSRAGEVDAIAICVPTPLNDMKEPDTSYMESAARSVTPYLHPEMLITLESTTYPGTTEEIIQPILESGGLKVGTDIYLAFSPERVDPGNPVYQTRNTPKVIGGVTPACTENAVALYARYIDTVVPVSSTRVAEMTKLLENTFRGVNIALMNELLMLCERMGISLWEVIKAAKTKPFGYMAFYPGPGLGGHCIPIDPFYLSWKAKQFDFRTEFIDLSGRINENMPYYVIDRLMDALNAQRKPLADSKVLVLGVAYKADIDDMRESPAIRIAELLLEKEADVVYHDPFVPSFAVSGTDIPAVDLTAETVAAADVVLIITAHSDVDYALVAREASLVLDTRNALEQYDGGNVVRL
ncbi:nucleotide sugar dehydrogenase [Anaerosoma tenue]|uniref:nucleotide sugar dehydrogenase n=1 Tax=Anaerosoma tenue TaxID=2933588 RepID=UPI002260AD7A|nr:nucleotide sugar dehydrogenase [Anaerosoma tenue]MCK8114598.1 nucleotide sugar dehydrogenase [Anaerosoma tenue]